MLKVLWNSVQKFSRYHINRAKKCIFQHVGPTPPWPWTFDLEPKLGSIHPSPKIQQCTDRQIDGQTDAWTAKNILPLDVLCWQRHKNIISQQKAYPVNSFNVIFLANVQRSLAKCLQIFKVVIAKIFELNFIIKIWSKAASLKRRHRSPQSKTGNDIFDNMWCSSSSKCNAWDVGNLVPELAKTQIIRPEIMSPLGHTMCLIDNKIWQQTSLN